MDKKRQNCLIMSHFLTFSKQIQFLSFSCQFSILVKSKMATTFGDVTGPQGHTLTWFIKCRTCGKLYIGKTGRRLGDRFRGHLRSTWVTDTDLPVHVTLAAILASSDHSVEDMLVSVIRSGFQRTPDRRRFEAKVIFQHRTLHPGGGGGGLTRIEVCARE